MEPGVWEQEIIPDIQMSCRIFSTGEAYVWTMRMLGLLL